MSPCTISVQTFPGDEASHRAIVKTPKTTELSVTALIALADSARSPPGPGVTKSQKVVRNYAEKAVLLRARQPGRENSRGSAPNRPCRKRCQRRPGLSHLVKYYDRVFEVDAHDLAHARVHEVIVRAVEKHISHQRCTQGTSCRWLSVRGQLLYGENAIRFAASL